MASNRRHTGNHSHEPPSSAHTTTFAILTAAERLRRRLAEVVEPYGVTLQQYHVMRILSGAGSAGLPTLVVAERMIEHTPGVTRLLDRLESKELVRRVRSATDRRLVLCTLSAEGKRRVEAMEAAIEAEEAAAVGGLSRSEGQQLIRLLGAMGSDG